MFFLSHLFLFLSLSGANCSVFVTGVFVQLTVVWLQQSSQAGCTRRQLHSEIAHTVQYGHGSCWVRKTSRRTERGDRGRGEGERERREERGRHENMWGSKGAREQSGTCEKCSSVFFFIALLWQHVWNWNVIRCLVWLLSLASTHSHPSQHTWKAALFNCWNNRLISSSLSFLLIFLTSEWCDTVLFLNFFRLLFCSLFLWPLRIKQGIKYDSSSVLQLETCESLWECGGVQNLPSLCERVKSQAGGSEYVWTIYVFSRHITPPPKCSGSLGAYCTVRQIPSMKTTPIPLLTPAVSSDCYDTVTLVGERWK